MVALTLLFSPPNLLLPTVLQFCFRSYKAQIIIYADEWLEKFPRDQWQNHSSTLVFVCLFDCFAFAAPPDLIQRDKFH